MATPSATSSSWNLTHPSEKLLKWSTKYILYDTNQFKLKKYEVNYTKIWMTPSKVHFYVPCSGKLPVLMVVCYLEAPKIKRSSRIWPAIHGMVHSIWIPYGLHSGYGMKKWLGCQPKNSPYGVHGMGLESIWNIPGSVKTSEKCPMKFPGEQWKATNEISWPAMKSAQ